MIKLLLDKNLESRSNFNKIKEKKTNLLKQISTNFRHDDDVVDPRSGCVGCVAILKRAAIGSYWNHGGLVVNISNAVQPSDLKRRKRS